MYVCELIVFVRVCVCVWISNTHTYTHTHTSVDYIPVPYTSRHDRISLKQNLERNKKKNQIIFGEEEGKIIFRGEESRNHLKTLHA